MGDFDLARYQDPLTIQRVLHAAKTIAVVGLSGNELRAAGVGPGTVRLSVGTESVADLIWDLEQGFALVAATAGKKVATA